MKKIDKLVLKSFLGPFLLTLVVVVFILLTQTMLKYFDDFVGKNLGFEVFAELLFYFSIFTTPIALPLAVLLSSLMTFGNLGEHFELTALKSAGISLLRALFPIFVVTFFITIGAFLSNNYIVPKANLKAFSLLYDIKKKKPSLDLKEGAFSNDIPGYSIKVNKKFPDGITLKDLIIYDHSDNMGNENVILADSGKMFTIMKDRYLVFELFDGQSYTVARNNNARRVSYNQVDPYRRETFGRSKLVLSLASFDFTRTREELFKSSRLMKNVSELSNDIDSLQMELNDLKYYYYRDFGRQMNYMLQEKIQIPATIEEQKSKDDTLRKGYVSSRNYYFGERYYPEPPRTPRKNLGSSVNKQKKDTVLASDQSELKQTIKNMGRLDLLARIDQDSTLADSIIVKKEATIEERLDSMMNEDYYRYSVVRSAASQARSVKEFMDREAENLSTQQENLNKFEIEKHKKYAQAFACLVMFLIGAPLGAIIKRGGLGVPVIVSIIFFIVYYVISMTGEKWARQGVVDTFWGTWGSNLMLLPIGLFFLKQARVDARLFDSDFYNVVFRKIRDRLGEKTGKKRN
jgi:lipopolysaccharide export system permease protein